MTGSVWRCWRGEIYGAHFYLYGRKGGAPMAIRRNTREAGDIAMCARVRMKTRGRERVLVMR